MSALKVHHEVSRNWEKGSSIHMQWVSDENGTYAYRFVTKRNQKEEVGIVPSQTILEELIHMARKSGWYGKCEKQRPLSYDEFFEIVFNNAYPEHGNAPELMEAIKKSAQQRLDPIWAMHKDQLNKGNLWKVLEQYALFDHAHQPG